MIPPHLDFRRLKARLPIVRVLDHYGLLHGLEPRGQTLAGPCPLHRGDNPHAFVVDTDKNLWHCFTRCHAGGDIVEFVRRLEGCSYAQAARRLDEIAHSSTSEPLEPLPLSTTWRDRGDEPFRPFTRRLPLDPDHPVLRRKGDLSSPGQLAQFTMPTDAMLDRQWHLRNTGSIEGSSLGLKAGADANVVAAWQTAETLGLPEVIVAVIDDGFDPNHPELSGVSKVVAPWDFTRNSADPRPEINATYPSYNPVFGQWEGDWHGTACAGVAIGNANGTGILGAAPGCRFMPIRWGSSLSNAHVTAWFGYLRLQGAAVASCSWSAAAKNFPLSTPVKKAIAKCATEGRGGRGTVICFAAGNEDRDVNDPAAGSVNGFAIHPDVIAVAACTSRDQRSNYSNFGAAISVCAPSSGSGGRGIFTADVAETFIRNGVSIESGYSPGSFTSTFGGTLRMHRCRGRGQRADLTASGG